MKIGQFILGKLSLIYKMVRHLRIYHFCPLNILNCTLEVTYALYLNSSSKKSIFSDTEQFLN